MPAFYTQEACVQQADEMKTTLAASKVRLYKADFIPTVQSLAADFAAAECDYSGYTPGGVAIAAWLGPVVDPAGGGSISMPTTLFATTGSPPAITNLVGGAWIEDAAGNVREVLPFASPYPMDATGAGFPLNNKIRFPTGLVV